MTTPAINIGELAPEERLQLIEDLWESLRSQPGTVRLTTAQQAELDRRGDEFDRGGAQVMTWDKVKRRHPRPRRVTEVWFLQQAVADLRAAHAWYEEQELGLGDEFADIVDAAVESIIAFPAARPVVYR
jgi:putative addiction module component (TIGR02574 family)